MAALTSVLSKRWRFLFAFSPNLDLFEDEGDNRQSFMDFVDRVFAVSGNSPIKKFTLSSRKGSERAHFQRWICDVLNRGSVSDLDLSIFAEYKYSLPSEVFTCKTIKKLKLYGFLIYKVPDAFLPALESIILSSFTFYGCSPANIISACPVLVELVIYDWHCERWLSSRTVTSSSLQRLTIRRTEFYGFDGLGFRSITFDTPSVTHLDYSDFVTGSYPIVNLDSLVEANLNLVVTVDHTWNSRFAEENDPITSDPTNLIKGLRNVEIMNLTSHQSLEAVGRGRGRRGGGSKTGRG